MLPTAVSIEKSAISPELRAAVMRLHGDQPLAFAVQILLTWLIIAGAIVAAEWTGTWWATALAVIVIATRQAQLFLLIHEQVHLLGFKRRFGDLVVNVLCAYPMLFVTTEGYAHVHLAHHRSYFTEADPDHLRKAGPEWTYPKPLGEIVRLVLRDVTGLNFIRLIRGKRSAVAQNKRPGVNPPWVRPLFYLALVVTLTAIGGWKLFLLYWILPILTVLQVIVRWGAVCEHEYNRGGSRVSESTPLIEPPWWQRALLPNMNFNLHIYHHYFPGVAFNNLPRVHGLFRAHGLVDESAVFKGYGAYLRHLQRGPDRAGGAPGPRARRPVADDRRGA